VVLPSRTAGHMIAGVLSASTRAESSPTWLLFICAVAGVGSSKANSASYGRMSPVNSVTFATTVSPGANSAEMLRATHLSLNG
jgi:hypothetical protein